MATFWALLAIIVATVEISEALHADSRIKLFTTEEKNDAPLFQKSIVDHINNLNPGWTAGYNERVHNLSAQSYRGLLGTLMDPPADFLAKAHKHPRVPNLPTSFDARERWPHCPTISEIRDQGHCGSCWAFGAVEALSDRFCIQGNESVSLSANDLLACCGFLCGEGCNGGWPYKAWRYFIRKGVVTNKCQSYFDTQGCQHPGCSPVYPTPKCSRSCADDEVWGASKHYAADVYVVGPKPEEIMAELFLNGPVEVDFTVYEDFSYYTGGVYKHVYGGVAGGHAVKLIGWGTTEEGVDYWTIANSWNKTWGEEGFFRIVRGVNECGIEADVVAGMAALNHKAALASVV